MKNECEHQYKGTTIDGKNYYEPCMKCGKDYEPVPKECSCMEVYKHKESGLFVCTSCGRGHSMIPRGERIVDEPKKLNYCGFETVDELIEDHKKLKEQIKSWEKVIDKFIRDEDYIRDEAYDELQEISHEMMAINI